jgi:flagellar motor switch protein FliM
MNQVLSPEMIGDLLQKARDSASAVKAGEEAQQAAAADLRQSRQLSPSQTKSVSALQEVYARRIDNALSAYLRTGVETKLASVEQISYSEFLSRLAAPTYLASFRIPNLETCGLMQIDLPLVFQILDLMLGGFGKSEMDVRDLTEIEVEIFQSVGHMLCNEMKFAWQPVLEVDCEFERRHRETQSLNLLPASEKVLSLSFDVTVAESQAKMTLAFPSAVSTVVFRELSVQMAVAEPVNSQKNQARIRELLLDSRFDSELVLPPGTISVRDIFTLQPGSTVVLQARASEPIHLNVAGKNMFLATPVRCGARRAAQVHKILSIAPEKERK